MTSSLVGSEMCIRDRRFNVSRVGKWELGLPPWGSSAGNLRARRWPAVSYTHLTLPTSVDLGGR
eukprot:10456870-Prorocentrum_lima.AAC.1